jgi:hypothetical protein
LRVGDTEIHDNIDKARIFFDSFFPEIDEPETELNNNTIKEKLEWRSLTEIEIERALKAAISKKTPDVDVLTLV